MFPIHDDNPRLHGRPFINYGLIGVNVIVFIYEVIITSNFSNPIAVENLFTYYGSIPNQLLSGQNIGSIFSSMFMHGGIAHIVGNMFFLYVFGDNLEDKFGHYKYLGMYLTWGVIASLSHSLFAVYTGQGNIPSIGASGAISGVLGAYLVFFPHSKIHTIIFAFFITTARIPAIAYIPFWFIMQLIFALIGQSTGVAYLAHIGGFIIGLGTAYMWKLLFSNVSIPKEKYQFKRDYIQPSKEIASVEKEYSPEIIIGTDFIDVIFEIPYVNNNSDIVTDFDKENSILILRVKDQNKDYSIQIPNPTRSKIEISSLSVNNGIIRIRLNVL